MPRWSPLWANKYNDRTADSRQRFFSFYCIYFIISSIFAIDFSFVK